MRRGTTQELSFTLPEEIDINVLYITFRQGKEIILEKTIDDVKVDGKNITLPLSQEDTLKFAAPYPICIQLRIRDKGGNAIASDIITIGAETILKEGVI